MRCTRLLSPAYRAGRRRTRRTEAVILPRLGTVPYGRGAALIGRAGRDVTPLCSHRRDFLQIARRSGAVFLQSKAEFPQSNGGRVGWRPGRLVFWPGAVLVASGQKIAPAAHQLGPEPHASLPLFHADPARDAAGGGDRLASADAARRPHPPAGGRQLLLA